MKIIIQDLLKSTNGIQNKIKLMPWLAFEVSSPGQKKKLCNFFMILSCDAPQKMKQNKTGVGVCDCCDCLRPQHHATDLTSPFHHSQ